MAQTQEAQKSLQTEKQRSFTVPTKPSSAPSSPYHGSVLNVLSRQVARDFEVSTTRSSQTRQLSEPPVADRDVHSEVEVAEAPLQFGRDDYKIDDSERTAPTSAAIAPMTAGERTPPVQQPKARHRPPRLPLQKPPPRERVADVKPAAPSDPPPVTPRNFSKPTRSGSATVAGGDVSPVGHVSTHSGEVSPIDSEDELELADARPVAVSPLVQRSFHSSPPKAPVSAVAAQSVTAADSVPQRAPVGPERARRRGGPTEDDYVKEEKREAYVLPEEYSAPPASTTTGAVAPTKRSAEHSTKTAALINKELPPIEPAAGSKKRFKPPGEPAGTADLSSLRKLQESAPVASSSAAELPKRPTRATSSSSTDIGPSLAPAAPIGSEVPRPTLQQAARPGAENAERTTASVADPTRPKRSIDSTRRKVSGAQHEPTLSHASSDSRSDGHSKPGSSPRAPQKSFDQLINSGETLSYTLTPHNLQEIEGRGRGR